MSRYASKEAMYGITIYFRQMRIANKYTVRSSNFKKINRYHNVIIIGRTLQANRYSTSLLWQKLQLNFLKNLSIAYYADL